MVWFPVGFKLLNSAVVAFLLAFVLARKNAATDLFALQIFELLFCQILDAWFLEIFLGVSHLMTLQCQGMVTQRVGDLHFLHAFDTGCGFPAFIHSLMAAGKLFLHEFRANTTRFEAKLLARMTTRMFFYAFAHALKSVMVNIVWMAASVAFMAAN